MDVLRCTNQAVDATERTGSRRAQQQDPGQEAALDQGLISPSSAVSRPSREANDRRFGIAVGIVAVLKARPPGLASKLPG